MRQVEPYLCLIYGTKWKFCHYLGLLTLIIKPNTSQPWMRTEWNWENIQHGTIQDTIFIFGWIIPWICCLHSPRLYIYICKCHLSSQLEFNNLIDRALCCKHPYQITRGHTDLMLIGYGHNNPYLPQTQWVIWFWMFTVGIQCSSLICTQTNVLSNTVHTEMKTMSFQTSMTLFVLWNTKGDV